jgi:GT2 family glycosyltransferase
VIPVIIVPILNQPEMIDRLLGSIDYPVERVVIIDNGGVVDPFIGGRRATPFPVHVINPGANLGVGASWNLGIKANVTAPWWLIVNHDIEFGPGDLALLDAEVEPRSATVYKMLGLAAFAITPPAIQMAGFCDENIHPAYNEDLDWERRMVLGGVIVRDVRFTGSHVGSATIGFDAVLRYQNGRTHPDNDRYYAAKWGGAKQGGETFETPFNRGGDVADWTLDIDRLRNNAWKR